MTEGIDIYAKYQTVTDWNALRRAGKFFVYMKMTDGLTTRDTGNWVAQAKAAGLATGAYGYAQFGSAVDQYNLLRRTAQSRGATEMSPALDLEDPFVPGNTAAQFAIAWLHRAADVGEIPVFYANDSMMSYLLATVRNSVPSVWPWIARYGSAPRNPYKTWQFSSTRQVPGIRASGVDENTGAAPIVAGGGGGGGGAAPAPTPSGRRTIARMEDEVMDPVIHKPTPVTTDATTGKSTQVEFGQQVVPPVGGILVVTPLDDFMCFFGNPDPEPPVYCFGMGGGTGGGHSVVDPKLWQDGSERRATRNNAQAYEIPRGTSRVAYQLSSNGRTAVQFVPSYLLG